MKTKVLVTLGLSFFAAAGGRAEAFDRAHALYGKVLADFVKEGRVDYAGLRANPKDLDVYLTSLEAVPESEFRGWPREDQLAFLINHYNARTLRLIVDHHPVKSIKDIGRFFKGPWDQPVVLRFNKKITLGDLEHKIIRGEYADPRVHFALVCAAKGCPPLLAEPYTGPRLNEQLERQGKIFLSQRDKNRLEGDVLYLSPIFDWFEEDFVKTAGSVESFIAPYLPLETGRRVRAGNLRVKWTFYDWSLNEVKQ